MRCQKARSCLSAYCNNELGERQSLEIRSHLLSCSGCRAVERSWRSMQEATREIPAAKVSNDFNARLLDRLAAERFSETRRSIPQPSSLGWLRFRQWIPALAGSAAMAILIATGIAQRGITYVPALLAGSAASSGTTAALDNSYLTAQPGESQQQWMASNLHEGQNLRQSLALSERVSHLSHGLTPQGGFGMQLASDQTLGSYASDPFQRFRVLRVPLPGSMVVRREIGFDGQTMRIYLMPSPDSQGNTREESTRY